MSTKVLVANLPPDATEDEVNQVMTERGWPMIKVICLQEDHPKRRAFMVEVDLPRDEVAEMIRSRGEFYYQERKLNVYVPVMGN